MRVIMRMYWGEPQGEKIKEPAAYVWAMILAVIGIVVLGVYPTPIYDWAISAAEALLP
jgi:NADH-quinone oxidoreductase subunit N